MRIHVHGGHMLRLVSPVRENCMSKYRLGPHFVIIQSHPLGFNQPIFIFYSYLMIYDFETGIEHVYLTFKHPFMWAVRGFLPLRFKLLFVPRLHEGAISCLRHVTTSSFDVHSRVTIHWVLQCLQKKIFGFSCLTVIQYIAPKKQTGWWEVTRHDSDP